MAFLVDDYQTPAGNQVEDLQKNRLRFLVKKPQDFLSELSVLNPLQLKEVQEYLWDCIMEESTKKNLHVTRSDIISRFEPTTNYQYRAGCKEPLGYCTLNMCIKLDPKCSINRLRGMIEILRKILADIYKAEDLDRRISELEVSSRKIPVATPIIDSKEGEQTHKGHSVTHTLKSKIKNLREILFSIIELDGAETVCLMDSHAKIVELVSNQKMNSSSFSKQISELVKYYQKLLPKLKAESIQTVTNEYYQGLMVIHLLNHDLFLMVISRTTDVPAKTLKRVVRISEELNELFDNTLKEK
ncbi:MAG: hypothetical protein J0L62_10155 [Bacteroidetes bacterium]|nr:hypothetical protein [Bacteroidota bacterium]